MQNDSIGSFMINNQILNWPMRRLPTKNTDYIIFIESARYYGVMHHQPPLYELCECVCAWAPTQLCHAWGNFSLSHCFMDFKISEHNQLSKGYDIAAVCIVAKVSIPRTSKATLNNTKLMIWPRVGSLFSNHNYWVIGLCTIFRYQTW